MNNFLIFTDQNNLKLILIQLKDLERIYGDNFKLYVGGDVEDPKISNKNLIYKDISKSFDQLLESSNIKNAPNAYFNRHITIFTYARLFIFDFFPTLLNEKFIYLDTDAFLLRKVDINNFKVNTAIKDIGHYSKDKNFHLNAGVFFIVDSSKFHDFLRKVLKYVEENPQDPKSKENFNDQVLMSEVNDGDIFISEDHNYNMQLHHKIPVDIDEPYIVHFTAGIKPWSGRWKWRRWMMFGKLIAFQTDWKSFKYNKKFTNWWKEVNK